MERNLLAALLIFSAGCSATSVTLQCGDFIMEGNANERTKMNGEPVTSEKITNLGANGIKVDMTLMPARDGNMYGFEYVHPDGSKRHWLNVELIRTNMTQPRIIGSFDCHRIKG